MLFASHVIPEDHVIWQNRLTAVFVNLKPILEGHVLVVPQRSVQYLHLLTDGERADLFRVADRARQIMKDILGTNAIQVTSQDGVIAGQSVPHVHLHVIPRNIPTEWKPSQVQDLEVRNALAAKYRRVFEERMAQM
jgi:bis(5'-adenosyl)-triphosphatase